MHWILARQLRYQGSIDCAAAWAAAWPLCVGAARSSSSSSGSSSIAIGVTASADRFDGSRRSCESGGGRHSTATWEGVPGGGPAAAPSNGGTRACPTRRVQLVRDFIHDSLYHPLEGYFSRRNTSGAGVVGSLQQPLDFASMEGQLQYLQAVREVYRQLQASWLTPVEILQPHYGRAIASCILRRWHEQAAHAAAAGQPELPLLIYEIGGGTGTLAANILDWLRTEHPLAYRRTQYRCVEISPVLAAIQRRRLAEGGHAERFSVWQHDAADLAAWRRADGEAGSGRSSSGGGGSEEGAGQHSFIVMCEVLDNLPHDRVCRSTGSPEWQQTLVAEGDHQQGGGGLFSEVLQPASDPLILRCLQAAQTADSSSDNSSLGTGLALSALRAWRRLLGEAAAEVRWLPTGCLQLLDTLQQARPSHTLIAADFDQLPEVVVGGVGAPLVASTHGGSTHDHGSYLVPRGSADIFFPTDFRLLCTLYREAAAAAAASHRPPASSASSSTGPAAAHAVVTAEHLSTPAFMRQHAPDLSATRTRSGYNPLLQDYTNTAFFVGSCQWQPGFNSDV